MSSKRGRFKRTKNVRNFDSDDTPSLQSIIDEHPNIIPAGRQLERTPPLKTERMTIQHQPSRPDGSPTSEQVVKDEPCAQEIDKHVSCSGSSKEEDDRKSFRRSSSIAASATIGNAGPEIFIQGMQGYQWTDTDLEFVYETKRKKQVQQTQQELSEVQKSLMRMRQMRDLALAAHIKIQTELSKVPSCERIHQISMEILQRSLSSSQLEGLDFKALLAKLKVADVLCTIAQEKTEVSKLRTEVEKAQALREKEEQLIKDTDSCQENINQIKVNVLALTAEIAALESRLSGKEEAPQSAKPRQKVHRGPKSSVPPCAPKPLKTPTVPKPSKPSTAPSVPKSPKTTAARKPPKPSSAPKISKPLSAPPAPKSSKPPGTNKDSKTSKPSKPTTGPKDPEGDVGGLRRSKRIAANKEK